MANIGEIYHEIASGIEQTALNDSAAKSADLLARKAAHSSWLQNSTTQIFLRALKQKKEVLYASLKERSSSTLADTNEIRWISIKLEQIDTILDYAEKHLSESDLCH